MDVSVIIPTCNRYDILLRNVENIKNQDMDVEILIGDDSDIHNLKANRDTAEKIKSMVDFYAYTAIYDHERNKLYGLGRARNRCVIESRGDFLIFLDDRISPAIPNMCSLFLENMKKNEEKIWYFGNKGADKKSFVENCSAVRRNHFIAGGMFPETVNLYGFMTRELHHRYTRQGFQFQYLPDVLAEPLCKGSGRTSQRTREIQECRALLGNMYR